MPLVDALLRLSNAQVVTSTAVSTDKIDLSEARDMAWGNELNAVIEVDEVVAASGAATVLFEIVTATDAALTAGVTVVGSVGPIGKAELPAGRPVINVSLDPSNLIAQQKGQRYLGVRYTVATGPLTTGRFTAYLTCGQVGSGKQNLFPSGFTVG